MSPTFARSYLYTPGDRPDRLGRAPSRGADAVIADLEDAVAPSRKVLARSQVREWLEAGEQASNSSVQRWVRINAETAAEDIDAVVTAALTGVMVPKGDVTPGTTSNGMPAS